MPPMSAALFLATMIVATATPDRRGPTEEWCGKKPAAPVVIDEDECSLDGHAVRVLLMSPSGCFDEDDMTLTFEQDGRRSETRAPARETRWWMLDADLMDKPSGACHRIRTLPAGNGQFLLLLGASGRPLDDRLAVALYDAARGVALDAKELVTPQGRLLGQGKGEFWFRQGDAGEGWSPELVATERDALMLPDGDRIVSSHGGYTPLNPIWHVRAQRGRILATRDLRRTYELMKAYFPTPGAFAAAFQWDTPRQRTMVLSASTATGRECIQPHGNDTEYSDWRRLPWFCERAHPKPR